MNRWEITSPQASDAGMMLLEASAGTGKTYNIASLVLRLIAEEGLSMGELVVVTFTRAATAELVDRIRVRLREAVAALEGEREPNDEVLRLLYGNDDEAGRRARRLRLARLREAEVSFDECLVSTIHGFCQRILQQHAFEANSDFDQELVDDTTALRDELVDDWLSSKLHDGGPDRFSFLVHDCGFRREGLRRLAELALRDPDTEVLPAGEGARDAALDDEQAAARENAGFVRWLRGEFARRMRARRMQSYQDLLRDLARALADRASAGRQALVDAIRRRYKVALIDEFQDTDALQWAIFRELFSGPGQRLVLIGDPKQAIYGFRGANVHVYLEAKGAAARRAFTMQRNFRSDARLLDALNTFMSGEGFFGARGIDYVRVEAAPRDEGPADRLEPSSAPLQLRFADRRLAGARRLPDDEPLSKGAFEALLPARVADDIVELLEANVRRYDRASPLCAPDGFRPLHPGDIAVLTRTGAQALAMQRALTKANVPSVLTGAESVLASDEAFELQLWLDALASPGRDGPARAAATTRLFGRTGTLLALVDREEKGALDEWERWLVALSRWRGLYARYGFLRAFRAAVADDQLAPSDGGPAEDAVTRLLRRVDGERRYTNLWHVAELLHAAETNGGFSLTGLLGWLRQQRIDTTLDAETSELRLERDDDAVAIMTVHKSKGLEFPVVFVPFLWSARQLKEGEPLLMPQQARPAERVLDLRSGAERSEALRRAQRDQDEEQLRLLYVALTRARLRCVLYTGHVACLADSPLAAALHGAPTDRCDDRIDAGRARTKKPKRSELWADLEALAARSESPALGSRTIALEPCARPTGKVWQGAGQREGGSCARDFLRFGLDRVWRRHSFSSMTARHTGVRVEATDREGFDPDPDEIAGETQGPGTPRGARSLRVEDWVPLARFPAGVDAGTFFHAVFERADFAWAQPGRADGPAALRALVDELLGAHGFGVARFGELVTAGLLDVLRTPLGGPLGATRLFDVPKGARFDELRFDLPIAGGASGVTVHSEAIVSALRLRTKLATLSPGSDELLRSAYLDGLGDLGELAGFLTGSIDLVFRHEREGAPQWFVVDYKSNRLDPRATGGFPIEHYALEGMRHELERHHYYVQYHLYLLALHRYLRLRLVEGYDYDRDVGGVYYLFFRGMIGDATPLTARLRHGCFYDKPPFAVIDALDRALSGASEAVPR